MDAASRGPRAPEEGATDVRGFAVVNVSELVERLAYYGVLSIVALYLVDEGYGFATVGALFAVLLPLPYAVPMVAGPVASKFGYKPVMLVAFVAYASGFLLLAASSALPAIFGGVILVGVGAGLFKPLTAAAIGLVTAPRHRSLGYSVYYVGINIGGFVGPLLIALLGDEYRLAFLVGAAAIGVDFLLVAALFRNPLPAQRDLSVAASFRPLLEVLRNTRFLVLLATFVGFWMLYSMTFSFVILYLQAYVELPGWFRPSLQVSLESLCVILLGVPLGAVATRMGAIPTMVAGVILLVAGFAVVGLFPVFPLFVLGILLVAAGEVFAYPGFLAYVSQIAPRDRVAVYQGYGFLPLFAGFLLGPLVAGAIYGPLVRQGGRPALFWAVMCAIGLLTLAALLAYARWTRAPEPEPARRRGAVLPLLPILVALLLVGGGLAAGERVALPPGSGGGGPGPADVPPGLLLADQAGTLQEGETTEVTVSVPDGAANVTYVLTWRDEGSGSPLPGAANQPDRFVLTVLHNDQSGRGEDQTGTNPPGGEGRLELTLSHKGAVQVGITLLAAGDTTALGQTVAADTGNAWTLVATAAR
jgi:proton-dependent oligopeptide transporter, POT family